MNLLSLSREGLSTAQILGKLRPRISQPTLWRVLNVLRAKGALTATRDVDIIPPNDDDGRITDQISYVIVFE